MSRAWFHQGTGEARDCYVPNPSCKQLNKLEWIGQLMGAALRGKDFLVRDACVCERGDNVTVTCLTLNPPVTQVLALPGLVWKQLTGEAVSWSKDFPSVDSVLVGPGALDDLLGTLRVK